jgi:hypothetical protein
MASGQQVLDTTTKGGWYRAADSLRLRLIQLGLPDRQPLAAAPTPAAPAAPAPAAPDPAPAVWPRVAAGIGLLLAVAAVVVLAARRRRPAVSAP